MYIHTYLFVFLCIYMYMFVCASTYVYIHVFIFVDIYKYFLHIWIYHVYMYNLSVYIVCTVFISEYLISDTWLSSSCFLFPKNPNVAFLDLARLCLVRTQTFRAYILWRQGGSDQRGFAGSFEASKKPKIDEHTLHKTNIPLKGSWEDDFLFYRCDIIVPWRVSWKMTINAKSVNENTIEHGDTCVISVKISWEMATWCVYCNVFFFRKSMTNEVRHFRNRNTSSNGFFQHPGSLDESFLVLNPDIPKIQHEEPLTEQWKFNTDWKDQDKCIVFFWGSWHTGIFTPTSLRLRNQFPGCLTACSKPKIETFQTFFSGDWCFFGDGNHFFPINTCMGSC